MNASLACLPLMMALVAAPSIEARAALPSPIPNVISCASARGDALAEISNALTSGNDANVLRAALASRSRMQGCGFTRDAESLSLIAADAYGDVNEPKQRCIELRTARLSATRRGDTLRSRAIEHALRSC